MTESVYKNQTSILLWLAGRGHQVDLRPEDGRAIPVTVTSPTYRWNGKPCPYCGEPMVLGTKKFPSNDHVHPKRAGGTLDSKNRLVVCGQCNNDKADMALHEFVTWLEKRGDPRADVVRRVNP
jgi:5-methylcytosine-specific restriction endonuclease McrA